MELAEKQDSVVTNVSDDQRLPATGPASSPSDLLPFGVGLVVLGLMFVFTGSRRRLTG